VIRDVGMGSLLVAASMFGCGPEQVDGFYYPDKGDLTVHEFFPNVGNVENCRTIVMQAAARRGDPQLLRGDYECGVGPTGEKSGEIMVYRDTVK
jgi:hypothetical protein